MTQNYIRQIEFIRQTNYFNFEVTMFEFTKDLSFFSIPNIHVSKTSVFHRTGNMGTLLPKKLRKSKLCTYILLFLLIIKLFYNETNFYEAKLYWANCHSDIYCYKDLGKQVNLSQ